MSATRSKFGKFLISCEKFANNVLPSNRNVVNHYEFLRKTLCSTDPKFFKKLPVFTDVKQELVNNVREIWLKAGLTVISEIRVLTKCKELIDKHEKAERKAKKMSKKKELLVSDEWWDLVFDISKCKCPIAPNPPIHNGKMFCSCCWEDRISQEEIEFLKDQRTHRKMYMSSSLDKVYANKIQNRLKHQATPRMQVDEPSCYYSVAQSSNCSAGLTLESRLRPKDKAASDSTLLDEDIQTTDSDDPSFFPKPIAGGKKYTKKRKLSINTNSCTLADRRHTSIRQQSDQILAVVGGSIAASPATVYRRREEARLFSLKECESAISESEFLQLHHDSRKIIVMERYVFMVQFYSKLTRKKVEKVVGVKSYLPETSVNSEAVLHTIVNETCGGILSKIYSVMSDTCRVNTGQKTGINKRLQDYIAENFKHDIYSLECMFHINEIYLSHVIDEVEGKSKGPNTLVEGALLNKIKSITSGSPETLIDREALDVRITPIAKLHLQNKLCWFSEQKSMRNSADAGFRSDQMC